MTQRLQTLCSVVTSIRNYFWPMLNHTFISSDGNFLYWSVDFVILTKFNMQCAFLESGSKIKQRGLSRSREIKRVKRSECKRWGGWWMWGGGGRGRDACRQWVTHLSQLTRACNTHSCKRTTFWVKTKSDSPWRQAVSCQLLEMLPSLRVNFGDGRG